ncbi:hypothetical protein [Metabacillus fastidiosus]|uniref:hypothetical protein n=1 Tax=Metabacillus fastidiosus TaxID=1458 RepID=UPI003D271F2A
MVNKHLNMRFTLLFLIILVLLNGCEGNKQQLLMTYKIGFPEKNTPGLISFIKVAFTDVRNHELLSNDGTFIFTYGNRNEGQNSINYYQYTEEKLNQFHEPLFHTKDVKTALYKMSNQLEDNLYSSLDDKHLFMLPSAKIQADNILKIETNENERNIDLKTEMKNYHVNSSDKFILNITAVSDQNFVFTLEDVSKLGDRREIFYLFIDRKLSHFVITQLKSEEIDKVIDSGNLKPFYDVFPMADREGNYRAIFNNNAILNVQRNKTIEIKETDLLSKDGKYVYINGDSEELSSGVQKIQSVENYVKQKEIYETEFNLDFNEIAEILKLKTSGISIAKVNYFNEDFIVLRLLYKGKGVGLAGATNAIIDLQNSKDNPTVYLIDLGME